MRAFFNDVARRNLEFRQAEVKFSCAPAQCRFFIAEFVSRARLDSEIDSVTKACARILLEDQMVFSCQPIGCIHSPYKSTQEVPKGLGAKHDAEGVLEILPQFDLGLTDIEGFSHLIVLWVCDRLNAEDRLELLGTPPSDNRPHGVFATRSPRRPNPIGFTVVELLRRDGRSLYIRGIDMLDGTPVLDLKPYLSSIPQDKLRRGWLAEAEARVPK
jgi:tRNA-Thr(GGU) m(6)t(6)A37 methyltransferase TsaA